MIDWDKPIETVDGLPARVISTDYKGYNALPLYVVQIEGRHFSHIGYYKEDGNPHTTCDRIRNARVKREGWILIGPPINGPSLLSRIVVTKHIYPSEQEALRAREELQYTTSVGTKAVFFQWEE